MMFFFWMIGEGRMGAGGDKNLSGVAFFLGGY